ncbi:hypothetical protein MMC26_001107 [Xylographa opegraphella]|nr:hypothetical protein [Xylographa opegraphella]
MLDEWYLARTSYLNIGESMESNFNVVYNPTALRAPSVPLQVQRPLPPVIRPRPPFSGRPRLPFASNNSPLAVSGRNGLICLSCQDDDSPPSPQERLNNEAAMERIFGSRARFYDNPFHRQMADDYLGWIDLEPGQTLIDMACGTGLISIPAKRLVGPSGHVTGIDISRGMLAEAQRKAVAAQADITFLQADVTAPQASSTPWSAHVITCAAAFSLLGNEIPTLRQWSTYLKPGGRIVFDIPTDSTRLTGQVLVRLARETGLDVFYGSTPAQLADYLRDLFTSAGLRPLHIFPSRVYRTVEYDLTNGLDKLHQALDAPGSPWKGDVGVRGRADGIYVEEYIKRMGRSAMVREDIWFYVGVGVKDGAAGSSSAE